MAATCGGGSGGALDFSNTGKPDVVGAAVEMKICEGGICAGRVFYRKVGSGDKLCKLCLERKTKLRKVN